MPSISRRILLVDDDEQLVTLMTMKLSRLGYTATGVSRADQGYTLAAQNDYDVIILDMVMPKRSGAEIATSLRSHGVLTPIIILSGKTDKDTIVRGLNNGADDYLTKPFSHDELIARIEAQIRRNKKTFNTQVMQRHGLRLDMQRSVVQRDNSSVVLTMKETLLLKRLMSEAPRPVPRLVLLNDVWGIGDSHASNRLDVYIRRLRKKLDSLCGDDCIQTIRGRGYYLNKP